MCQISAQCEDDQKLKQPEDETNAYVGDEVIPLALWK